MNRAIKVLAKRVEELQTARDESQRKFDNDEYEMVGEMEFLLSDIANLNDEIIEIQDAIMLLQNQPTK